MPKTAFHVYYDLVDGEVQVLTLWGARRGDRPALRDVGATTHAHGILDGNLRLAQAKTIARRLDGHGGVASELATTAR